MGPHWAGDVKCDYENMAGLRALLGAGMSGFPFFSHDIGGFVNDPTPDLFMRWFQFGMFSSRHPDFCVMYGIMVKR